MFHVKHLERGQTMNRRSNKLDKFIGKNVEITFLDGDVREGVLFLINLIGVLILILISIL